MPKLPEPTVGDTSWFVHDRFGLFIHWGIYSLPARHEWVKHRECIRDEDYQKYFGTSTLISTTPLRGRARPKTRG